MRNDPRTKEQFVDRMLSYDFDGDFTDLGATRAKLRRISAHKFHVDFPATGQRYEIVVRKPRRKVTRKPTPTAHPTVARRRIQTARPVRRAE